MATAQMPDLVDLPSAAERIAQGDRHHSELQPLDALRAYQAALTDRDAAYDALWRSARAAVNLGMLAPDEETEEEWYKAAEGYARRAGELREGGAEAHEWLAITLGRRALKVGSIARAGMAEEIRSEALEALQLDSARAGAHHVLGVWNAEIRRLGGFTRFIARNLLGASVMGEASWEAAEHHLRTAVELAPTSRIHRLELAKILLDTGQPEEARPLLLSVTEGAPVEPADPLHMLEAEELLRSRF